jgi:hypothetical protein
MTTELTLPLVHMNGTGKATLCDDYDAASEALRDFIDAWGKMEFNSRDYYPLGPDAWGKARDARDEINRKIRDIDEYIDAHRAHLHGN